MSDPVVEIEQGKLKGSLGADYHGGKFYKFLGIPYAKAPIGELRFKAPQPPDSWSGIKNATKEGPECPASDMYFTYFIGNEDNCLNLNVYTKELPNKNESKCLNKPVMVWIHGGAFICGSNKTELYGPDYLMTQDIVLVTINYRLGILGFASFKDQSLGVPGNAGLKDQRMALKWVQNNITHFGGDPNNVTIFGESAGAASVHYLTLSPTTEGLFHKAIVQSGSALNNWAWGKNNSGEIAKFLGYKETDEKAILDRLKKESAKNIINAQKKSKELFSASQTRPWGPVVEPASPDAILTAHPTEIMHSQGGRKIPLIIGYNSGEGIFFELVRKTIPGLELPKNLEHEIPFELGLEKGGEKSKEVADKLKKAYFDDNHCNEEDIENVYKLKGDTNFIHSIQRTIKLQAKHSHQPVYAYRMSLVGPLNYFHTFAMAKYFKTAIFYSFLSKLSTNYLPLAKSSVQGLLKNVPKKDLNGVVHADDLLYLFPTFYTPSIIKGSPEDLYIQRFVKLWTNFAKHGEPTPDLEESLSHVKWKPVNHENLEFLDIGHDLKMIENIDGERLKLWDEIYEAHLKV
ncbi:esterase B1-like [Anthonomus grandis grandis]|uniref:esterase B1-like n=1 Tax=Anthonomus grandis grandis TaxID=2921223 RepID=UPI002165D0B1|nr:esterase B1-like [Anthonomus grandis grandis]XP_050307751.1 esterase B1-like [Anthonomus grandis grandis]